MSRWSDALAAQVTSSIPVDTCDTHDTTEPQRPHVSHLSHVSRPTTQNGEDGSLPLPSVASVPCVTVDESVGSGAEPLPHTPSNLVDTCDTSDSVNKERSVSHVSRLSHVSTPIRGDQKGSLSVTSVPENKSLDEQGSQPVSLPSAHIKLADTWDASDTSKAERSIPSATTTGSFGPDRSNSRAQPDPDEVARLVALKAEVEAARQVLHAELAAVAPILGEIFRAWPGATITGVADGPPPAEAVKPAPPEPPSPEAVEVRARELLARAEQTLGVTISDRAKALDYYRFRATAELTRRKED